MISTVTSISSSLAPVLVFRVVVLVVSVVVAKTGVGMGAGEAGVAVVVVGVVVVVEVVEVGEVVGVVGVVGVMGAVGVVVAGMGGVASCCEACALAAEAGWTLSSGLKGRLYTTAFESREMVPVLFPANSAHLSHSGRLCSSFTKQL
jgi:hypothetical protein